MSNIPLKQPSFTIEEEYLNPKLNLYKKLFKYLMNIFATITLIDLIRSFSSTKLTNSLHLAMLLTSALFLLKFVLTFQKKQELIITIFIILFYSIGIVSHCYNDPSYFENPLDSFYLAYGFALLERLIAIRIPNLLYRTIFSVATTVIRMLVVPCNDKAVYTIQFICLFFGFYLDHDKEKHDRDMFFNSREQLIRLKNLIVNDVLDGIMIVSQDLKNTLFVNNSLADLLETDDACDIRSQLSKFMLQDITNNNTSRIPSESLLNFFEKNKSQGINGMLNQRISCDVIYTSVTPLEEKHQQNSVHLLETKLSPIVWDGKEAIVIIMHNVTQQYTVRNLKKNSVQKDAVLVTVSNELRTPLNGMLEIITRIQRSIADQEMGKYLNTCEKNVNLLMGVVNSILDLNQIKKNTLKLEPKRVEVREVIANIVGLFESQCAQKGIFLKTEIAPGIKDLLFTDESRLSQILISLMGNALKFTSQGGITIAANAVDNEQYVELSVKDTGIGIKNEDKERLLKGLDNLELGDGQGNKNSLELSLKISNRLARMLCDNEERGGVKVKSLYKAGSTFSFVIKKSLANRRHVPVRPTLSSVEGSEDIDNKVKTYVTPVFKKPPVYQSLNTMNFPRFATLENEGSPSDALDLKNQRYSSGPIYEDAGISLTGNPLGNDITPTVLIVDDNPFNIAVADCLVTHQGYKVVSALYGQVAIDMVLSNDHKTNPIKLILMDCQMPVMDGYETTRRLRAMMNEKKIPNIPIVPLTANDSEADKVACRRAGMLDHLSKPLKEGELVRVLRLYA